MRNEERFQQPFFIHFVLKPDGQSSIIQKLIDEYSRLIQKQNPQFRGKFKQKQQKLLRHNNKLQQISDMSGDEKLRDKILQEIQIKDYQKQFKKILSVKDPFKKIQKQNRTFHFCKLNQFKQTKQVNQSNEIKQFNSSQKDQNEIKMFSLFKESSDKKFRSSLIKKNSFSSVKTKNPNLAILNPNNLNLVHNIRKSQDLNSFSQKNHIQREAANKYVLERQKIIKDQLLNKNIESKFQMNKFMGLEQDKHKKVQEKQIYHNKISDDYNQNQFIVQQQRGNVKENINVKLNQNNFMQKTKRTSRQNITKRSEIFKNRSNQQNIEQNPYHYKNFTKQLNSFHYSSVFGKSKLAAQHVYKSKYGGQPENRIDKLPQNQKSSRRKY